MKTENAVKKLNRAGFLVKLHEENRHDLITGEKLKPSRYTAIKEGYRDIISFHDQRGEVVCINVRDKDDHGDVQRDYHAGVYVSSIKSAIAIAENSREG